VLALYIKEDEKQNKKYIRKINKEMNENTSTKRVENLMRILNIIRLNKSRKRLDDRETAVITLLKYNVCMEKIFIFVFCILFCVGVEPINIVMCSS
jgi:hypothetical protein